MSEATSFAQILSWSVTRVPSSLNRTRATLSIDTVGKLRGIMVSASNFPVDGSF